MQTITIDIINNKALKLIKDLELLQLIRVRRQKSPQTVEKFAAKYKGSMSKQSVSDIENQLKTLRSEWR